MNFKKLNKLDILIIIFILVLFLHSYVVKGQTKALNVAIGFTTPFGPSSGFTLSALFGIDFDEAVFYGFGLDFANGTWVLNSIENNFIYFPLYGALRIRFPFSLPFALYSIMGVGYSFLIDKVQNEISSSAGFYGSFFWKVALGFGFMLGTKTDGIFEVHISSFNFQLWGESSTFQQKLNFVTLSFYFGIRFFRM